MSRNSGLSLEAVHLLLQLLELPEPLLTAAAAAMHPNAAEKLLAARLLTDHDYEEVVTAIDDHDDAPVALTWYNEAVSLTYFSPVVGLVHVSKEQLVRRRVDIGRTIAAMAVDFDLPGDQSAFELIDGLLWEVGDARLGTRSARVPVWFGRRLWNRPVQQQITATAAARRHPRQRILLTSSSGDRVRDFIAPGVVVVSLRDVLVRPEGLAINPEILGRRFRGVVAEDLRMPLGLSPDGTMLRINGGNPIFFRSESQMTAIRLLVDAHRDGRRLRVSQLTTYGSLRRLFGSAKWEFLQPYLTSVDNLWGFDL